MVRYRGWGYPNYINPLTLILRPVIWDLRQVRDLSFQVSGLRYQVRYQIEGFRSQVLGLKSQI